MCRAFLTAKGAKKNREGHEKYEEIIIIFFFASFAVSIVLSALCG
jgi:hypothetical protein